MAETVAEIHVLRSRQGWLLRAFEVSCPTRLRLPEDAERTIASVTAAP